ncbi:MAG: lysylphosphatidylglycerol synthase transmembrane domain-containing protein [Gemmatimonadales bacterium]
MRNKILAGLAGLLITVGLLAWVLKGVSFTDVWQGIRSARWPYLLGATGLATFSFVIRVPRWRVLLRSDEGAVLPSRPLWHGIAIGFMANNLIPFRAGEVLRALAINRLAPVGIPAALSSLVAERLFDALTIVAFLFIGLVTAGIPADAQIMGFSVTAIAGRLSLAPLALLVACVFAIALPHLAKRITRAIIPWPRLAETFCGFIDGIHDGLAALKSPRRVLAAAGWSLIHWFNNGLSFYLGFKAFGIPIGLGGALLLQSVLVVLIATPSTPGYFGVFEAAIKSVLVVLAVEPTTAVTYALAYHFTTYVPITLLGLWSLSRTTLTLRPPGGPVPEATAP